MTPFLPGYEPGTWVEIVSGPEMLCSLQYDYGTTFTLTDSLPYDPILGKQGKIVAILGKSPSINTTALPWPILPTTPCRAPTINLKNKTA